VEEYGRESKSELFARKIRQGQTEYEISFRFEAFQLLQSLSTNLLSSNRNESNQQHIYSHVLGDITQDLIDAGSLAEQACTSFTLGLHSSVQGFIDLMIGDSNIDHWTSKNFVLDSFGNTLLSLATVWVIYKDDQLQLADKLSSSRNDGSFECEWLDWCHSLSSLSKEISSSSFVPIKNKANDIESRKICNCSHPCLLSLCGRNLCLKNIRRTPEFIVSHMIDLSFLRSEDESLIQFLFELSNNNFVVY
jgi:hypothetical protein